MNRLLTWVAQKIRETRIGKIPKPYYEITKLAKDHIVLLTVGDRYKWGLVIITGGVGIKWL